jgi:polyhydroxyalkanoate synthesis regulator phasin
MAAATTTAVVTGLTSLVAELLPLIVRAASGGITDEEAKKERDEIIARHTKERDAAEAKDAERLADTLKALDEIDAKRGGMSAPAHAKPMTGLLSDDGSDAT